MADTDLRLRPRRVWETSGNGWGTEINNIVHVAPAADQGNYTSVKAACDAETTSGTLILLMPGVYEEDPFTIAAGVSVDSWGVDVATLKAKAANPNDDLVTIGHTGSLRKVNILSPTNAYGVTVTGAGISGLIESVAFLSGFGAARAKNNGRLYVRHGVVATGLQHGFRAEGGSLLGCHGNVIQSTVRSLEAVGAGSILSYGAVSIERAGSVFYVDDGGRIQGHGADCDYITVANMHTGPGGGELSISGVNRTLLGTALDVLQEDASGEIHVHSVPIDAEKISAVDASKILGYGHRTAAGGDEALGLWSGLHVGAPGVGRETVLGQGDVTSLGSVVYQYDGVAYTDISTQTKTSGSPFTVFPNLLANTAIYFGWHIGVPVHFYGLEFDTISQALVGGSVVAEYWNGAAWLPFTFMVSEEEDPYDPQAMDVWQNTGGSEHLRFQEGITNTTTLSDPVGYGTDLYWVRFRITAPITTSPIMDVVKMVPTRTRFDEEGIREMDGLSRVHRLLPWGLGELAFVTGFGTSPSATPIWLSDQIAFGVIQNTFGPNADTRLVRADALPHDTDTSSPLLIDWEWIPSDGNAGNVSWHVTWSWADATEVFAFANPGGTHTNEQTANVVTAAPGVLGQRTKTTFELNISGMRPKRTGSGGDILFIAIKRDSRNVGGDPLDTYAGNAVIIDFSAAYLSYEDGQQSG